MTRAFGRVRIAAAGLPALVVCACLPGNPMVETMSASSTTIASSTTNGESAGGDGLFGCELEECTFVVVSQTLDDRVDVFDVSETPRLRARIALDLKPDPSGLQTAGDLLDEPYGLTVQGGELRLLMGHYPTTARGSLVSVPESLFAGLEVGALVPTSDIFDGAGFIGGARDLPLERQEAIFALPHSSGRMIVGVFANDLRAVDWPNPSQLLIVDPTVEGPDAIGAFDLGTLDVPCQGAWGLAAVDDAAAPKRVALACDGSDSVAVVNIPADLGDTTPAAAAEAIDGCGVKLLDGWTTRFLAADGAGGVVALQSQLIKEPRVWRIGGTCSASPSTEPVTEEFSGVRTLAELVLLKDGAEPVWLAAGGVPATGLYVLRGAQPQVCGQVSGLDGAFIPSGAAANAPYALALADDGVHLAIGSGPPSNPESADGRGQVHWVTLDLSAIDSCEVSATEVVDLTDGLFAGADPTTWVRAPNVIAIVNRTGGGL